MRCVTWRSCVMSSSHINLNILSEEEISDIKNKANESLGKCRRANQIIRDDIFSILEKNCKVFYYPINDDDICAFIVKRGVNFFIFINTHIPLEKQVFAAAHELYHLWHTHSAWEVLKSLTLDKQIDNTESITKEENKANRFAAEFLVPESLLITELLHHDIRRNKIDIKDIIELMDVFLVPYKTIVRRLYEVDYLENEQCNEFLQLPDRDEDKEVRLWQKRLELCNKNNVRTERIKLDNLVDMSLDRYEKKQITLEKLSYLLNFVNQKPEDYSISEIAPNLPSEEEILRIMEEED